MLSRWLFLGKTIGKTRLLVLRGVAIPAAFLLLWPAQGEAQVTFAGTQISVAHQGLASPTALATDGKGNLFIADTGNNRVVYLAASSSGLGAPVTILSGLESPTGVAVDWSGNVYVSDTGNNRILMLPVTSTGFGPAVVIARSLNTPSGIAVDAADNVYVADAGNNRIVILPRLGNSYGAPAVLIAGLSNPRGVAVDAGLNLYIADTGNNRALKETWSATRYTTQQILGKQLLAPAAIAVDPGGNVYVTDTGNNRVVEEIWAAGQTRFNGQVSVASVFASPSGVIVDGSGKVYVEETASNQTWQVLTTSVNFPSTPVGVSAAVQTYNFNIAAGTVIGSVSIYTNGMIGHDFTDAGSSSCLAQSYAALTACGINVAFTPSDSGARMGALVIYDPEGNILAAAYFAGMGLQPKIAFLPATRTFLGSGLSGPSGVAIDGNGNVFIADTGNNRVVELPWSSTGFGAQITLPIDRLNSPMGLMVDAANNLYVVSNGNDKVVRLPWMGSGYGTAIKLGTGMYGPSNVAADSHGNVYITDTLDSRLDYEAWTGSGFAKGTLVNGSFKFPTGIAVDIQGDVYITNPYLKALVKLPKSGTSYLLQVPITLSRVVLPTAIAVDGNLNLYVLDTNGNQLVMLPWNGNAYGPQVTVATGLNGPTGLALDRDGNVYVADTGNNQVIKFDLSTPAQMNFANTYLGSVSADSAQGMRIGNRGNESFAISSISYAKDFPEAASASNLCADESNISVGGFCNLSIDFAPQAAGTPLQEAATFAINTGAENDVVESIPMQGTALGKTNQTITFPAISNVIYGSGPVLLSATSSSGLAVSYKVISGSAVLAKSGTTLTVSGVGTVVIEALQVGNSSTTAASPVTQSFLVTAAVLTIKATNISAVYGTIPTSFSYTTSGFVNGDNAMTAFKGTPAMTSTANANSTVGSYAITPAQGNLVSANYSFRFVSGTLAIGKAPLTITPDAVTASYGASMPKLTYQVAGLVSGDTAAKAFRGAPVLTSSASSKSKPGSYRITAQAGTMVSSNYSFQWGTAQAVIAKAVLTISPRAASMTYGGKVPLFQYDLTGFMNGDTASTVSGKPAFAIMAPARANVGSYAVTAELGTLASAIYSFKMKAGVVTVNKATLTVVPQSVSMTYGSSLPVFTYQFSGLLNGDTAGVVTGKPVLQTSVIGKSTVGSYKLIASVGTLKAANYSFQCTTGVVTVMPARLSLPVNIVSMKQKIEMPKVVSAPGDL